MFNLGGKIVTENPDFFGICDFLLGNLLRQSLEGSIGRVCV